MGLENLSTKKDMKEIAEAVNAEELIFGYYDEKGILKLAIYNSKRKVYKLRDL